MGGQYTRRPPGIIVVGSAARDVVAADRRGWRLGGSVSYCALTVARLGVPTAALVGVDRESSRAAELDLLRQAGVDVVTVELPHAPVFENVETPAGRRQRCVDPGTPLPVDRLPSGWAETGTWLLTPVAGELLDAWADVPPADAAVGVTWQGLLRTLSPNTEVTRRPPEPSALVGRADVIAVSVEDLNHHVDLDRLTGVLRSSATLLVTRGTAGGLAITHADGRRVVRRYPAVTAAETVDPTGAGDVFLGAFMAALADPTLAGPRGLDSRLRVAATTASFAVERPGLLGVPDLDMVRHRALRRATGAERPATTGG
jgi:sugar/nucleoside kinase (ribokinase family)